jgi:flagellar hook-associated protein 1 FlgK
MSLIGTLNLGANALAVQQAALQVTGNNISNAGNADYTRQATTLEATPDQQLQPGIFLGTGVNLTSVQRQIDDALQGRLRSSISDNEAADQSQQWLGRIEATFNELSDSDLSTQLSTFFTSWGDLANKPQDIGLRQVVIQNGQNVADFFQNLRGQLSGIGDDLNQQITSLAGNADALAQKVADLNGQITVAEGGSGGTANGLRDERDADLKQLAQLINIQTVPENNGSVVNVYVGSQPLVLKTTNLGVTTKNEVVDGKNVTELAFKSNNGNMNVTGGQLGGLTSTQSQLSGTIDQIDSLAGNLIFELNKLHASGQGLAGFSSAQATNPLDDKTVALNDPKSGLKYPPTNGSFVVHVTNKNTGLTTSTLVQVDLNGQGANDTTLDSLTADLNGVAGITATDTGGTLKIAAGNPDTEISFSQDSSGVLAALGINNFYQGTNASNITVNPQIANNPQLLAAAKNGQPADNQTALAIANLQSVPMTGLNGSTLTDSYESMINKIATSASAAQTNTQATQTVVDTLTAQRESLSGVSLDEEAVNLMKQQRAFQGAARLITAVNDMLDEVMNLVK